MIATELHPWRCANPECGSHRSGSGQIVMRGLNTPGWMGEGRCHRCGALTLVRVTEQGVEFTVRPCKNRTNGG